VSARRYQHLRADRILATLDKLQARINARFPEAGLAKVCADLIETARFTARDAARLARPAWGWRVLSHVENATLSAPEVVQGLEAAVNLLILFGGAVWFVLTLEERTKRRHVLDSLHRLRSLAHVIDMHQLTKDPTIVLDSQRTHASPERTMSQFELTRYLDYCSEMLALIGKLAALYAERMRDGVVVDAVNDIENLTTSLGRKIWQKITILSALDEKH
jgi:hypothetical protein